MGHRMCPQREVYSEAPLSVTQSGFVKGPVRMNNAEHIMFVLKELALVTQ